MWGFSLKRGRSICGGFGENGKGRGKTEPSLCGVFLEDEGVCGDFG